MSKYELWMVERNIEHAHREGLERTLARLKGQGYDRVAAAVEEHVMLALAHDNWEGRAS